MRTGSAAEDLPLPAGGGKGRTRSAPPPPTGGPPKESAPAAEMTGSDPSWTAGRPWHQPLHNGNPTYLKSMIQTAPCFIGRSRRERALVIRHGRCVHCVSQQTTEQHACEALDCTWWPADTAAKTFCIQTLLRRPPCGGTGLLTACRIHHSYPLPVCLQVVSCRVPRAAQ